MIIQNKLGPYSKTKVEPAGYLGIFQPVPIPASSDDILYKIIPAYTYRPDLLAYDLYGVRHLWWVFAQRNLDVLKDPVFDFVPGTEIYLPQGDKLKKRLGM